MKKKIEIDEIKNKFKELKSLVYEFKKNKDIQIHLLNEKQKELEIEIEKNKNNYNSIIEDTTNKFENFIKKVFKRFKEHRSYKYSKDLYSYLG